MEEKKNYKGVYNRIVKRALDIVLSALIMIVFSWLFLMLSLFVLIFHGAPVMFVQERPGRIDPKTGDPRIFKLYKFRSMTNETDANGKLLPDSKRTTKFGKLLRKTSLDELPEIWNIFKGEMSFVGPRPWLVRYLKLYNDYEIQRQLVRPGLTGWAQVNGRNAATWSDRFKYDIEYVNKVSLGFDIKIMLKTVKNVLTHSNIDFDEDHESLREYHNRLKENEENNNND